MAIEYLGQCHSAQRVQTSKLTNSQTGLVISKLLSFGDAFAKYFGKNVPFHAWQKRPSRGTLLPKIQEYVSLGTLLPEGRISQQ